MLPYDEQPMLSQPTDTAVLMTPNPIFSFHAGAHPFCARPGCLCHHSAEQLKALLQGVVDGKLKLRSVASGTISWEVR